MMPAMSPLRLIVDESRETSCVRLVTVVGLEELLSSRPKAKNAPEATSAPQRPPTSAPTRNWRRRFRRSGGGAGGPGWVGRGGVVGGWSGHAGGGEEGTVTTSAGGKAASVISLAPGRRSSSTAATSPTPPDPLKVPGSLVMLLSSAPPHDASRCRELERAGRRVNP